MSFGSPPPKIMTRFAMDRVIQRNQAIALRPHLEFVRPTIELKPVREYTVSPPILPVRTKEREEEPHLHQRLINPIAEGYLATGTSGLRRKDR